MEAKGAVEFRVHEELLTPAMVGVGEEREDALIFGGGGFKGEDGGLKRELETGADVDWFGALGGGRHFFWREDSSFPGCRRF